MRFKSIFPVQTVSSTTFTFIVSILFIVFFNTAFFKAIIQVVDITSVKGFIFSLSVTLVTTLLTALVISLVVLPRIAKPVVIVLVIAAAFASYFMNTYGILIHSTMIQNTMETDAKEVASLFNATLVIYVVVLGIIPSILIARTPLKFFGFKQELFKKLRLWGVSLLGILILIVPLTADYASFFRNNKNIRQLANPVNFIYATMKYVGNSNKSTVVSVIGDDAKVNSAGKNFTKPILFVLVVGETARADHFSINGYEKETTPLLAKQSIINFTNVTSCGTETAISVPCMFSSLGRKNYSDKKAKSQEGLLDVLKHAGYSVFWRDNNSSCKGVCDRVPYEKIGHLNIPELCNEDECFDDILLNGLTQKMEDMQNNKVIVLHQMGSHGPEYFKRYPKNMEIFTPVCKVNKLQDCSFEELNNAYDNTIRYTDHFLNNTIEWLKSHHENYSTAMIYLSDHGESLGEKNLYLHGMPYLIAPKEQKHIPFFFWLSDDFIQSSAISLSCMKNNISNEYSHDNLFHTVLGLLNVDTTVYKTELDMISGCKTNDSANKL